MIRIFSRLELVRNLGLKEPISVYGQTKTQAEQELLEGPHLIRFRVAASPEYDILPRLLGQGLYGLQKPGPFF